MERKSAALRRHRLLHASRPTKLTGTGQLTYFIFEGVLSCVFGNEAIQITAWSGGAGGSRRLDATADANNPYSYAVKGVTGGQHLRRGGPIPPGSYRVHPPANDSQLGLCSRLQPLSKLPNDRSGFAIHGQGPKGSDGCIVIPDKYFHNLMENLRKSGGGHLRVCQALEDSVFV